jgi:hypothetical protein
VVERRAAQATLRPTTQEMYRGEKTSYLVPDESHKYASATFHVKATGGVFRPDSPWSTGIRFDPVERRMWLPKLAYEHSPLLAPPPPTLTIARGSTPTESTWSEVEGSTGYILERRARTIASGELVAGWKSIYDGRLTRYYDLGRIPGALYTYRVKALGRWGQTAWSEQVNG